MSGLSPRFLPIVLIVAAISAGCVSDPVVFNTKDVNVSEVAAVREVFAVTSRTPTSDPAHMFDEGRSKELHYVGLEVGIPEEHRPGRVEAARNEPNPAKHFTLVNRRTIANEDALREEINRSIDRPGNSKREILIFVHGYNNSFASSIFRQTQMLTDFGVDAVALNYSWPSASRAEGYIYDRDSAIFAQDGLVDVLRLAISTDAEHITVFAHSMGSLVTVQALRSLVIAEDHDTLGKIDTVVLAAPDVDIDVFDSLITDIGPHRPREFTILVSNRDRALGVSSSLRGGHPRVGQSENAELLQDRGIVVLDVSKLDGGGHATFAGSQALIEIVRSEALEQTFESVSENQDTATVVNGAGDAASLLIFIPARMLSSVTGDGSQAPDWSDK
ncbi:MAG: alpha/beta hydrolase [Pseudomonadota bacterium]